MTSADITEIDVSVLAVPPTAARTSEASVAVLAQPPTDIRLSEVNVAVVAAPPTGARIPELAVAVLAYEVLCVTRRAELWLITRTDGVQFGFTSLDEDFTYCGVTYKTCGSLNDTASESSSDLGSVGDQTVAGILSDDGITDEDLYAGRFDNAFVDVLEVNWDPETVDNQTPFAIHCGYLGKITRQQNSWTAEVLGMGARLQQTALVDEVTPGCGWEFGDPATCGVDVEALKTTGVVSRQVLRDVIFFSGADFYGSSIWDGGKVRWTSGRNAGIVCQVNTVDTLSNVLSLWDLAPYPPQAGDTFDLLPGCPKTVAACKLYNAYLNYGGFPDVPGPDALQSNADSLFTGANG